VRQLLPIPQQAGRVLYTLTAQIGCQHPLLVVGRDGRIAWTREGREGCVTEKPGFMYSALPTIRTPGLAVGHSAVRSILQGHDDGKKGTPYQQVVWRPADREERLLTEERKRVLTRKKKRARRLVVTHSGVCPMRSTARGYRTLPSAAFVYEPAMSPDAPRRVRGVSVCVSVCVCVCAISKHAARADDLVRSSPEVMGGQHTAQHTHTHILPIYDVGSTLATARGGKSVGVSCVGLAHKIQVVCGCAKQGTL
jgi:hypothetical protein